MSVNTAVRKWVLKRREQNISSPDPQWIVMTPGQKLDTLRDSPPGYMGHSVSGALEYMNTPVLLYRKSVPIEKWIMHTVDICDVRSLDDREH